MDKYAFSERELKWEFTKKELPNDISHSVQNGGVIEVNDLSKGGTVSLISTKLNDQARIDFPSFIPAQYDEIRFRVLLKRNSSVDNAIRLGFYTANDADRISYHQTGNSEILINGGTSSNSNVVTTWGVGNPVWMEIVWKPGKGAWWYLADRVTSKKESGLPDPTLLFKPSILCRNNQSSSTAIKRLDIYSSSLTLIVYSK